MTMIIITHSSSSLDLRPARPSEHLTFCTSGAQLGSDDFSWQTHKHTLHHNIYIGIIIVIVVISRMFYALLLLLLLQPLLDQKLRNRTLRQPSPSCTQIIIMIIIIIIIIERIVIIIISTIITTRPSGRIGCDQLIIFCDIAS